MLAVNAVLKDLKKSNKLKETDKIWEAVSVFKYNKTTYSLRKDAIVNNLYLGLSGADYKGIATDLAEGRRVFLNSD